MNTEPADPAASAAPSAKVDPETLALRGVAARPVRFRRNVVIALSAVTCLALGFTTWMALKPPSFSVSNNELTQDDPQSGRPDDRFANAPASYDAVPQLGPPLPGDLGRPILARERATPPDEGAIGQSLPPTDAAAEIRIRREQAQVAARSSAIMMALSAKSGAEVPPTNRIDQGGAAPEGFGLPPSTADRNSETSLSAGQPINAHAVLALSSPWTISAGTMISASLITGLNSDLPGTVVAQVTENVFDSATGRTLLVPQGSRLIGRYESNLRFAQARALLVWQRIIWPDGSSIRLEDMPATDASGQTGIRDRVDLHSGALLKGVALSTLLGVGTELSFGDDESGFVRAIREAAQSGGNQAGKEIVRRSLDIQPTITVRPGWPVRVLVHRDLVLRPWNE